MSVLSPKATVAKFEEFRGKTLIGAVGLNSMELANTLLGKAVEKYVSRTTAALKGLFKPAAPSGLKNG